MALHSDKYRIGLLLESFAEMSHLAQYAINYRKTDRETWGPFASDGILGIGAAVLLFSMIDAMGSLFRRNHEFVIPIDGRGVTIDYPNQHIYILNSKYFGLGLSREDLDSIYKNIRSPLIHNSLMPSGFTLQPGEQERLPVNIGITKANKTKLYVINMIPLFNATTVAVSAFQEDILNGAIQLEDTLVFNNELKPKDVPLLIDVRFEDGSYGVEMEEWLLR